MNSVAKIGTNQNRDSISIWRVFLPSDVDRNTYIQNCYLTGTVTLTNENGEEVHRVKVGKLSLQLIDFPADRTEFGSEVICTTSPYSGELRVVDVFSSSTQYSNQSENQYRFYKTNGVGSAGVLIDGAGNIILTVDGDSDNGSIIVNVTNKNRKGTFILNVNGELNVANDGNVTIKSTGKIIHNNGSQPMLLGTDTVKLISDLLDQLGKESAGPYPLLGQSVYKKLKEDIDKLKSSKSFLE